jgi:hypothetical protein
MKSILIAFIAFIQQNGGHIEKPGYYAEVFGNNLYVGEFSGTCPEVEAILKYTNYDPVRYIKYTDNRCKEESSTLDIEGPRKYVNKFNKIIKEWHDS